MEFFSFSGTHKIFRYGRENDNNIVLCGRNQEEYEVNKNTVISNMLLSDFMPHYFTNIEKNSY